MSREERNRTTLPRLAKTGSNFKDSTANPFYVPDDAEIFRMNDIDKEKKKEERQHNQSLKIWEKGGKTKGGLTMKDLKDLANASQQQESININRISLMEAAKSAIKNRVKSNEPMHEYIDKKREMLLFQMLIDHKREQINEYEELTRRHRKGLEKAEEFLQEDMESFNSYLNQNKVEARKAIKDAEEKTRQKNEKVAILKSKLEVKADLTGKNTSKQETVENLLKYKDFLDSLLHPNEPKTRRKKQKPQLNHNITNPQILQLLEQQDQQQQMSFKDPTQLMNIFVNLQEQNLFLMANLKTIEQNIEVVRASFLAKRKVLDSKKHELLNTKAEILKQIHGLDKEIEHIKSQTNREDSGELFNNLENEIIKSSREFGEKGFSDQKIQGLEFLKDIEKRLEQQTKFISESRQEKPALIQNLQKACFSDKREKKKLKNEEQIKEQAIQQRIQEANHREKRHGRPIMMKSKLKMEEKEVKVEIEGPQEEEIERRKYLT